MAMDMDIDMDIDLDIEVEASMLEPEPIPTPQSHKANQPAHDDPSAIELTPHKVHLQGLDNLTSTDIKGFATEYYPVEEYQKIEWIDDSSANLVYSSSDVARDALSNFSSEDISMVDLSLLNMILAKPFPAHPETRLEIRIATVGDRKQAGARERSRFYLFNPEHDRGERRNESGRGGRKYRDRDDGSSYRNQRYDDRENRRREAAEQFEESLYDDDEQALAKRRGSSSSGGHDGRRGRLGAGKELFPDRARGGMGGRLNGRNRSASPTRDGDGDSSMISEVPAKERRRVQNEQGSKDNRHKASLLRNTLRDAAAAAPKELFPQRPTSRHRRTSAIDARDETADLFASKANIRDGRLGDDDLMTKATSLGGRQAGFKIRGNADAELLPELSIKGAASNKVKELFPVKVGSSNAGKELFGNRGGQRQRAEDLFR